MDGLDVRAAQVCGSFLSSREVTNNPMSCPTAFSRTSRPLPSFLQGLRFVSRQLPSHVVHCRIQTSFASPLL
jgi:hypothetical protein